LPINNLEISIVDTGDKLIMGYVRESYFS